MGRNQKEGFQPEGMRLPFNNVVYCSGIVSDGIVNITNMKYGHVTLRELIEVEEVPLFSKTTKGKFINFAGVADSRYEASGVVEYNVDEDPYEFRARIKTQVEDEFKAWMKTEEEK